MKTILFNSQTCIRCGKCIKVCPSAIIRGAANEVPTAPDTLECIACGHCAAVCPNGSINHSDFPASTIHPVDYTRYPSPEQLMLLIRARRSNRAFSKKTIPEESLRMIAEAAHCAPTASNAQGIGFTLITDKEQLAYLSTFTIGVFDKLARLLTNPLLKPLLKRIMPDVYRYEEAFSNMKAEYEKGNDLILRGATAVLLIDAPLKSRFGCEDANLAYQNASLMAESLGVSQFYTGFVLTAMKQGEKRCVEKKFGINGKIYAGMALGLPLFQYPNYIDRNPVELQIV